MAVTRVEKAVTREAKAVLREAKGALGEAKAALGKQRLRWGMYVFNWLIFSNSFLLLNFRLNLFLSSRSPRRVMLHQHELVRDRLRIQMIVFLIIKLLLALRAEEMSDYSFFPNFLNS